MTRRFTAITDDLRRYERMVCGVCSERPAACCVRQTVEAAPRLVTTDYVVDETLTLLRVRGHLQRALALGTLFWEGQVARLEYLQPADLQQAWNIFSQFRDKAWSFTDCTSLAIMRRLGITAAVSLDAHFQQMPGISVRPLAAS
jgi:predicted nucleic acid-binding protein